MCALRTWLALLFALAATACWTGCPTAADDDDSAGDDDDVTFDPDLATALTAEMEALGEEYGAPGVVVSVRLADGASWTGAVGWADAEQERPWGVGDPSLIASVTKTYVAAVVLQLVGEGEIALDDPLATWLPDFTRGDEITVRDLLQHTSGIPELAGTLGWRYGHEEPWTAEELVALVDGEPLLFEPGTGWSYSNSNYVLLGLVIEGASGQPWGDEIEGRLLDPLALDATRIPLDDWGDVPTGYLDGTPVGAPSHPTAIGAAGCMVASAENLARWAEAYFGGDVLAAAEHAELAGEPVALGGGYSFGLGVLIREIDGGVEWAHNGALVGHVSWAGHLPEEGASLSMLANSWPLDPVSGEYAYSWTTEASEVLWSVVLGG